MGILDSIMNNSMTKRMGGGNSMMQPPAGSPNMIIPGQDMNGGNSAMQPPIVSDTSAYGREDWMKRYGSGLSWEEQLKMMNGQPNQFYTPPRQF